jgi:hypothetical protein
LSKLPQDYRHHTSLLKLTSPTRLHSSIDHDQSMADNSSPTLPLSLEAFCADLDVSSPCQARKRTLLNSSELAHPRTMQTLKDCPQTRK